MSAELGNEWLIYQSINWDTKLGSKKTRSLAAVAEGEPTVPPISEGQRPTSGREKKAISQSEYSPVVTLLYRTPQLTMVYDW